ncbi:hypothetical protein Q4I30_008370 [Leishmania utingensis]|uniref:RanBD1 domain-containing protein n=1 Tax=Leishmania utingensis TaxID=653362 RepID=A0AAW2ZTW0_9TRYP
MDKEKPLFKVPFVAGKESKSTVTSFSFAAPESSASQPSPSFGFPTSTTPSESNLGGSTTCPEVTGSSTKPAIPFSFGGSQANNSSAPTGMASSFCFHTSTAPSSAMKKPVSDFSVGFLPAKSSTTTTTEEAPAKEPTAVTETAQPKAPIFGAGSFNFGSAVNSFVEARKKMQEENKDQNLGADDDDDAPKDGADGTGFGSEIVEQSAREVLATAPSKLFLFEKGKGDTPGRWVEHGRGEAKLVAEEKTESRVHVHRLLVRGGYSLNATVGKNLFTLSKAEARHLIVAVATSEGPHTYLLKFTGPNAEANTTKFSEAIKKIMQEETEAA